MRQSDSWRRRALPLLPASLLLVAITASPCAAGVNLRVMPQSIQIGTFFGGAQVEVSAEIPKGCDAVVELVGKEIEEQLLRKGRHWDIWMNVGEIDIEGAPSLYFATSTNPRRWAEDATDSAYGYNVVQERVSFLGDVRGLRSSKIFDEFIKLKESEGLYGMYPGALMVSPLSGDRSSVQGTFTIPSSVAPGSYLVRLSVLSDGRLVESESARLDVGLVRLPALLSSLARRHGALHGLLAVAVAVVFGYLTGVAFKRTGGSH